jgi:hypothetical protein
MLKRNLIRSLHILSLKISSLGERIWNLGGSLEVWCDEQ